MDVDYTAEMIKHVEDRGTSIYNKESIKRSTVCGCFYCCEIFDPIEIKDYDWCDNGQTALCPHCGIDSVIGDDSGLPIEEAFLLACKKRWF